MSKNNENKGNFEKDGIFYILGEFDETIGQNILPSFRKKIDEEILKKKSSDIRFFINSCGGNAYQLISILTEIDRAKRNGVEIETNVIGRAYSCGSLLACSGTKGKRNIGILCDHLVHFGSPGAYGSFTPKELEREQKRAKRFYEKCSEIYRKNAKKKNVEELLEMMQHDNCFLSAEESVKFGLSDNIIT